MYSLTSVSFVASIDDPSKRQTPNKARESAVHDVLSLVERCAVFFSDCINTIHNSDSQTSGYKPADHTNDLSWYFSLGKIQNLNVSRQSNSVSYEY